MKPLKRKAYKTGLRPLQMRLADMAHWLQANGHRLVVVFEGRDTAGKGGAIDAIRQYLNPRQCRVAALPRPTERESTQWYFQRYVAHLPAAGEIVLFDRSWYNRAGVEKVMGFANHAQVTAFLRQTPAFEKLLVDDGIILFKYWLCCDQRYQEQRLQERLDEPLKRWKLSPIDVQARNRYADYTRAREAMLKATHTDYAPWTLVDFDDQRRGRLTLIHDLLERLPKAKPAVQDITLPPLGHAPLKECYGRLKPLAPWGEE